MVVSLAGQQVAQVMNFSLTGQTGMQAFPYYQRSYQSSSASTTKCHLLVQETQTSWLKVKLV